MQHLLEQLFSNPTYSVITILILVLIIFIIVKKLFKLLIYAILIFICFLAYIYFTGGNVNETINKTKEKGEKLLNETIK